MLAMGIRMVIPAVVLGLWIPSLTKKVLEQSTSGESGSVSVLGLHSGFPEAFGVLAVAISLVGFFFFIARSEYGTRSYILPVFTGLLLAFLLFIFPLYELGPDVLYSRAWSYLGLLMAIFAGYGVALYFRSIPAIAAAVALRLRRPPGAWITVPVWSMGAGVVLVALTTGLVTNGERQRYPNYYHVINDSVSADFDWMGRHTTSGQMVAMGEPSIGWAYPPVAGPGRRVLLAVSSPFTNRRVDKLRQMLASGEADIPWLRELDVSVFYACRPQTYTCGEMTGDGLFKVHRGVYLVRDRPDRR